jgi:hypothetical protein
MLKWLLTLAVVLFVLGLAGPWLSRLGLGRLPGDVSVERRGRRFYFPVATSIVLSLALMLVLRLLRI